MDQARAELFVDLKAIGPELTAARGAGWATSMLEALQQDLRSLSGGRIRIDVEGTDPVPALAKSPESGLVFGGLLVSIAAATGYTLNPKLAQQIVEAVWKGLKKFLQRDTRVKIELGSTKIEITTASEEAASSLLRVGTEVASTLATSASKPKRKRVATITPKKR